MFHIPFYILTLSTTHVETVTLLEKKRLFRRSRSPTHARIFQEGKQNEQAEWLKHCMFNGIINEGTKRLHKRWFRKHMSHVKKI